MCFQVVLEDRKKALESARQPPPVDDRLQQRCGRAAGEQFSLFLRSQGRPTFSMADVAAAQPDDLLKAASAPGAANGAAAWLDGFADADRPRSASGGSTADESEVPSGWTGTPTDKEQKSVYI